MQLLPVLALTLCALGFLLTFGPEPRRNRRVGVPLLAAGAVLAVVSGLAGAAPRG